MTVLSSYIDRAFSAKSDKRPQFQQMIKDSAKGLFNVIVVWKVGGFFMAKRMQQVYEMFIREKKLLNRSENTIKDYNFNYNLFIGFSLFYRHIILFICNNVCSHRLRKV